TRTRSSARPSRSAPRRCRRWWTSTARWCRPDPRRCRSSRRWRPRRPGSIRRSSSGPSPSAPCSICARSIQTPRRSPSSRSTRSPTTRSSSICARRRPTPPGTGPARCVSTSTTRWSRAARSRAAGATCSTASSGSRARTSPSACAPRATRPGTSAAGCARSWRTRARAAAAGRSGLEGRGAARLSKRARLSLSLRMAIGLVLGAGLGVAAHVAAAGEPWLTSLVENVTEPAGQLFLRMLFALVIPLIVSALPLGVTGLGDLRRVGRLGLRTLAYTVTTSAIAVALGVTLVNLFAPGLRVHAAAPAPAAAPATAPSGEGFGVDFFLQLVPKNPVEAMARGDMLAVMVFSLFLGIGLAATRTAGARRLEEVLQGVYDVVTTLLGWVIQLAPYGVAFLLFTATARMGFDVLRDLAAYVGVVLAALAIHMFGVYSTAVRWLGRTSPLAFFRGSPEAMISASSTASS